MNNIHDIFTGLQEREDKNVKNMVRKLFMYDILNDNDSDYNMDIVWSDTQLKNLEKAKKAVEKNNFEKSSIVLDYANNGDINIQFKTHADYVTKKGDVYITKRLIYKSNINIYADKTHVEITIRDAMVT